MHTLATDGCAMPRSREDTSVVQKRFGFPEHSVQRWSRTVHGAAPHSSTRARRNIISLSSRPHSVPSGTSLRGKTVHMAYRAMRALRQTGNNKIQGPFTLTLRRRRQRLCEGRTGRAIIVMTVASRRREASIVHVQRTDQARP